MAKTLISPLQGPELQPGAQTPPPVPQPYDSNAQQGVIPQPTTGITRHRPGRTAVEGKADAAGNVYDPFAPPPEAPSAQTRYTWGPTGAGILDPNTTGGQVTDWQGPGGTSLSEMWQDNIGYAFVNQGPEAAGRLYDQLIGQGFTPQQIGGDPRQIATEFFSEGAGAGEVETTSLPSPTNEAGTAGQDTDFMGALGQLLADSESRNAEQAKANDERFQSITDQMTAATEAATAQQQQMMTMMMGLMNPRREEDENRGSFTYNALGGR